MKETYTLHTYTTITCYLRIYFHSRIWFDNHVILKICILCQVYNFVGTDIRTGFNVIMNFQIIISIDFPLALTSYKETYIAYSVCTCLLYTVIYHREQRHDKIFLLLRSNLVLSIIKFLWISDFKISANWHHLTTCTGCVKINRTKQDIFQLVSSNDMYRVCQN